MSNAFAAAAAAAAAGSVIHAAAAAAASAAGFAIRAAIAVDVRLYVAYLADAAGKFHCTIHAPVCYFTKHFHR